MSTVIIPGHPEYPSLPAGKLANALFSIAVAAFADPSRLARGRAYAADHAVQRIEVSAGALVATVQGGQPNPYLTTVHVATVPKPELVGFDALRKHFNELVPEGAQFSSVCTCPDWDAPCKHAVAALVAFAHELIGRPELLVEFRCHDHREERAAFGGRAKTPAPGARTPGAGTTSASTPDAGSGRHLRLAASNGDRVTVASALKPWERPEWTTFLGAPPPLEPELPDERAKVGHSLLGAIDIGAWLTSALDELADGR